MVKGKKAQPSSELVQYVMTARIESTAPLLMHNVRTANPIERWAREMKELNKKKKARGADMDVLYEQLARVEWEGGLYHLHTEPPFDRDPSTAPWGAYLPSIALRSAIHEAAKVTREGQSVLRGLTMIDRHSGFELLYDGPKDVDGMWTSGEFTDARMVTVARSRVARTRPIFRHWGARIAMVFDPEVLSEESLRHFLARAGTMIGVGDGRTVLQTGRFVVRDIEVTDLDPSMLG